MATFQLPQMSKEQQNLILSSLEQWVEEVRYDEEERQATFGRDRIILPRDFGSLRGGVKLHPFQIEGVDWLLQKYVFKASGAILADMMGLGKTLQVIAYIAAVLEHYETTPERINCIQYNRPSFLIVCPLSVLSSWTDHLSKHCPETVTFLPYHGTEAERDRYQEGIVQWKRSKVNELKKQSPPKTVAASHACVDVVVTTYETIRTDKDFLTQFHWTNVILDEAHRIKNAMTQDFTLFKRIPIPFLRPKAHAHGPGSYRGSMHDFITPNPGFVSQSMPPLSQRVIDGNGVPNFAEQGLEGNKKKPTAKDLALAKNYTPHQHIFSYDQCIVLTGTLIQNNIAELWTLLHLTMPKIFPLNSKEPFSRTFELISCHNFTLPGDPERFIGTILSFLHGALGFVMLRRTQESAALSLPPKTAYVLFSGLTTLQKRLYRSVLGKNQKDFLQCLSANPNISPDFLASTALMNGGGSGGDDDNGTNNGTNSDGEEEGSEKKKKKNRYQGGRKQLADGQPKHKATKLTSAQLLKSNRSVRSQWIVLRKILNHAYLIPGVEPKPFSRGEHTVSASGKLVLLDEILSRVIPKGHRVLIFSGYTETLDILQDYCDLRGYKHSRLDGSVRGEERGQLIQSFQSTGASPSLGSIDGQKRTFDQSKQTTLPISFKNGQNGQNDNNSPTTKSKEIPIFLLSTRAAGVGITLTAADTVIFYDSDFNQAADQQAEQRCYRIGQDKPVLSLRLICRGSIDHLYYLRSVRKQALADAVMQEGRFKPDLSEADKADHDRQYVNIVVPDDVMVGDPEAVSVATDPNAPQKMVEVTDAKGRTFFKTAAKYTPDQTTDHSAVNVAFQCLSDDGMSQAKLIKNKAKLDSHEKEKLVALLYPPDYLDWIAFDGYSPGWGRDGDDNGDYDELDDEYREERKKRQGRIGGLSDFMNAAAVRSAQQVRQANTIKSGKGGTLEVVDNSERGMTTLNEEANGEATTVPPKKVFDPTNIPTMRLVHLQDIVTTDFDKDEDELQKQYDLKAKAFVEMTRNLSALDMSLPKVQKLLQDLDSDDDGEFELSGLVLEDQEDDIPEENVSSSRKGARTTTTTTTTATTTATNTLSASTTKSSVSSSSHSNLLSFGAKRVAPTVVPSANHTPTTLMQSKYPPSSSPPRQSKPAPRISTNGSSAQRRGVELMQVRDHFEELLNALNHEAEAVSRRGKAWTKQSILSPLLPDSQQLAQIIVSQTQSILIPSLINHLNASYISLGLSTQQWEHYQQLYFDQSRLVPPDHLALDVTNTTAPALWTWVFNQQVSYYTTQLFVRERFVTWPQISQSTINSNAFLPNTISTLAQNLVSDLTAIISMRLQVYLGDEDLRASFLPTVNLTNPDFSFRSQSDLRRDIIFTLILIATQNALDELQSLLTGLSSITDDFYHFIPLERLMEKGIHFPASFPDANNKVTDPQPISTLNLTITSEDDFKRWLYNVLTIHSPVFNNRTQFFDAATAPQTTRLVPRYFPVPNDRTIQLEQSLQYCLVYMANGVEPKIQNQIGDESTSEEDLFGSDPLINHVAWIHHINGNMLTPYYSVGTPRSVLFPIIAEQDQTSPQLVSSVNDPVINDDGVDSQLFSPTFPMSRSNGYIILNLADNSGRFGRGRLFSTMQEIAPTLASNYSNAKELKQCQLGQVILGPITNPQAAESATTTTSTASSSLLDKILRIEKQLNLAPRQSFIANLIMMDAADRSKSYPREVEYGLDKIFAFAKIAGLVVITSKLGYSTEPDATNDEYYAFERTLTTKSSLYNVDCYTFHHVPLTRSQPRQINAAGGNISRSNNPTRR